MGIAPVTKASGQSREVHWRWSCPKFVRQTFQEWAACSIPRCAWAREYYRQQRDKGQEHHAAVRSLAFKWIRILFRCWRDRVPYSEAVYADARGKARRATPPSSQAQAVLAGVEWKSCGGFKKLVCKSPELSARRMDSDDLRGGAVTPDVSPGILQVLVRTRYFRVAHPAPG